MLRTTLNAQSTSWHGPKNIPIHSSEDSLGLLALQTLELYPDRVVQVCEDDGSQMIASELKLSIVRVALNLSKSFGIEKGHVIGIVAKNTKYLAAVVFGAFTLGAPISPMDPSLSPTEIAHLFNLTRPKLIICDENVASRVRDGLETLNGITDGPVIIAMSNDMGKERYSILDLMERHSEEDSFCPPKLGDTDDLIGAILSSSGSTGPPKAVAISQTILKYYATYSDYNIPSTAMRMCFSTLHWYSGVISLIAPVLKGSPRIITTKPFSPELTIQLILKYKINYFVFPSRQLTLISEYLREAPVPLPSIMHVDIGGSLANVNHIRQFKQFLPNGSIGNFYGMTEIFGLLTRKVNAHEKYCAGQLLMDGEVKIVNEEGQSMGVGEKGEILIKPWFKCLGYYDQGKLSTDFLTPDGFVQSGDIGFFDTSGDLHIVDRIKETFKFNNFHVSPSELENVILQMDGVLMAQVVGLPAECGINMLATAFVIKVNQSQITEDIIRTQIQSQFSQPKWLHGGVYFLDTFPTTVSGKVSKRLLREWALGKK